MQAAIQDNAAKGESASSHICSLTGQIAFSDSDLPAVNAVREEAAKDCSKVEVTEVVVSLKCAISII